MSKAPDAFRTIGEVAQELDLPQHVLRFWESQFPHIKPVKRAGGRRYYCPEDIDLLRGIRRLLYSDGCTIKGVQRILKEQGLQAVQAMGQGLKETKAEAGDDDTGELEAAVHDPVDDVADDPADDRDWGDPEDDDSEDDVPPIPRPRRIVAVRRPSAAGAAVVTTRRATKARFTDAAAAVADASGPAASPEVSVRGIAVQDLERLKNALAGLEACRRLLQKAVEGE